MCSAFPCFKQLLLTFSILSTEKIDGSLNVVCCHKTTGKAFRWCRQYTASHAHFSQHSAQFVTLHIGSCEQLCTCLRASKRLFIIVPHIFSRFSHPTSSFCSTPPPLSSIAHPLLHRSGVSYSTGNATLRACGSSVRMADNALLTGYEPNKTASMTCIDVSSEYTPINIAVRRQNFDIENDFENPRYPRTRTTFIKKQLAASVQLQVLYQR